MELNLEISKDIFAFSNLFVSWDEILGDENETPNFHKMHIDSKFLFADLIR